ILAAGSNPTRPCALAGLQERLRARPTHDTKARFWRLPLQKYSARLKYNGRIGRAGREGVMRRLGVVENIAHDGTVLIRSEFAPSRGADVRDKRNRPLGRVVKVFGPVQEPFAAVRPVGPASLSLIGADVFVDEGNHANQEDRRGRRSY